MNNYHFPSPSSMFFLSSPHYRTESTVNLHVPVGKAETQKINNLPRVSQVMVETGFQSRSVWVQSFGSCPILTERNVSHQPLFS